MLPAPSVTRRPLGAAVVAVALAFVFAAVASAAMDLGHFHWVSVPLLGASVTGLAVLPGALRGRRPG